MIINTDVSESQSIDKAKDYMYICIAIQKHIKSYESNSVDEIFYEAM